MHQPSNFEQATCPHPENMRSTLHGFGQKQQDIGTVFCRQCQQHVDLRKLAQDQMLTKLRMEGSR